MPSTIFTSTIAHSLKETLEDIIDDDTDGVEAAAVFTKYLDIGEMEDAYEDDLEMGGPGLASEIPEGVEIGTGTIQEGYITRYIARKFGQKLHVTEEALEDGKYKEVIKAAARLKRSLWKTADIDAANILNRMFNTSFTGGDDQPLGSSSHTLPGGGTFSNQLATAFSPSRAAVIVAVSQIRQFPGHDGVTEGNEPETVLCPLGQWAVWDGLTMSPKVPESNNNEINVVQKLDLDVVAIKFWTASATNWAIKTDADGGIQWRWRRRPKGRSWVDNDQELMKYSNSARWARGWSDPRGMLCVNA